MLYQNFKLCEYVLQLQVQIQGNENFFWVRDLKFEEYDH